MKSTHHPTRMMACCGGLVNPCPQYVENWGVRKDSLHAKNPFCHREEAAKQRRSDLIRFLSKKDRLPATPFHYGYFDFGLAASSQ